MPRVSPRPLKKEIEKEITANLDWTISQLKSEPVAKDFLEDFLTDEERLMLAKRLAVIYLLKEGAARDWLQNQVAGTIAALQARKGTGGDYFDMRPPDPENSELWRELFPTDGPRPDGEATA